MEENDYVDFVVTARHYKTRLTKKYMNRPVWQKQLPEDVVSALPGTVIRIMVKPGQQVEMGELVMIHEAMKMLNRIVAPVTGVVKEIYVREGDQVGKHHLMIKIEPK
ncbi:MAG: acetyl-CoA carboxylase biotin carboxyl carrier protein subunit [Tannerellaceae bacterium]|jgi:biotin carboxyl carrier protein|nr:acetyl-CoA carboxylase biotin carboxyl carrier protein subunit [Tannerellaceae bacterium]